MRELVAVGGDVVPIPDPERLIHLQFRRFAGCPICNLHLRSIVRRHDEITAGRSPASSAATPTTSGRWTRCWPLPDSKIG